MEEWKIFQEYPNYEISNQGNVKNIKYNRILNPYIKSNGYVAIKLSKYNKYKEFKIHRLVGLLFVDNPDNKPHINHKDEIKTNNYHTNIEWCDSQYNNTYGTRLLRQEQTKKLKF